MITREDAAQLVKKWITTQNKDEEQARDKNQKFLWWFTQGSANFYIHIFSFDKGNSQTHAIEVGSPVMLLPENPGKKAALLEHVMRLNSSCVGHWWAMREERLMLLSSRELFGLDWEELETMIENIRFYADFFDDVLKSQFS